AGVGGRDIRVELDCRTVGGALAQDRRTAVVRTGSLYGAGPGHLGAVVRRLRAAAPVAAGWRLRVVPSGRLRVVPGRRLRVVAVRRLRVDRNSNDRRGEDDRRRDGGERPRGRM